MNARAVAFVASLTALAALCAPTVALASWTYRSYTDEMTSKPITTASTLSKVLLPSPNKPQRGMLLLRAHPRFRNAALVSFVGGPPFRCSTQDGCSVTVRFDEGAPRVFAATLLADDVRNVLAIEDFETFYDLLTATKRVRIEVPLTGLQGSVLDFSVAGLRLAIWRPDPATAAAEVAECARDAEGLKGDPYARYLADCDGWSGRKPSGAPGGTAPVSSGAVTR